ncbi:hypothetical protein IWX50DRAFT_145818 [Phyllosticta citricarpa]|uniref:Uncharacterized protein n=1 Tax=Phyllosticta citricarpa TaxID=55181 RepID=A0ABR1M6L4_9PEZI
MYSLMCDSILRYSSWAACTSASMFSLRSCICFLRRGNWLAAMTGRLFLTVDSGLVGGGRDKERRWRRMGGGGGERASRRRGKRHMSCLQGSLSLPFLFFSSPPNASSNCFFFFFFVPHHTPIGSFDHPWLARVSRDAKGSNETKKEAPKPHGRYASAKRGGCCATPHHATPTLRCQG